MDWGLRQVLVSLRLPLIFFGVSNRLFWITISVGSLLEAVSRTASIGTLFKSSS